MSTAMSVMGTSMEWTTSLPSPVRVKDGMPWHSSMASRYARDWLYAKSIRTLAAVAGDPSNPCLGFMFTNCCEVIESRRVFVSRSVRYFT